MSAARPLRVDTGHLRLDNTYRIGEANSIARDLNCLSELVGGCMRQALRLVTLTVICIILAAAAEQPLQPIDRPTMPGEKRCAPFFATTTFGGATTEQIVFAYQTSLGDTKRDTIPKTRALVRVTDVQAPTYESIPVDGQNGAVFRLNQVEYEKARDCLPKPEPNPKANSQ